MFCLGQDLAQGDVADNDTMPRGRHGAVACLVVLLPLVCCFQPCAWAPMPRQSAIGSRPSTSACARGVASATLWRSRLPRLCMVLVEEKADNFVEPPGGPKDVVSHLDSNKLCKAAGIHNWPPSHPLTRREPLSRACACAPRTRTSTRCSARLSLMSLRQTNRGLSGGMRGSRPTQGW